MTPVNANAGEYKSTIGLDSVYIAEVTVDSAAAYTADTPEIFAPAMEASVEPNQATETQYADDQAYDVMFSRGEVKFTFDVTNIPAEMIAKISGMEFDATTGRVYDNGGTPPYMALSFRSLKSNGSYRYYQFLKGKFEVPKESFGTKGASPEPKPNQVVFTAIKTTYKWDLGDINDGVYRVFGDDDTTNFSETGWFTSVQQPAVGAPAALSLSSSVPVDGATGVVITSNLTLTFNNALINNAINNVALILADGTAIACTNSLDATKKIMTINPDASLAAATAHILVYAVMDIYGQDLQGAVNFTTA
jgi:phi13 family phage major tail protein